MKYRVIGIIAAFLLLGWLAAHWLLPARIEAALEKEITRSLEKEAPGQYVADISRIRFNLLFTRMHIDQVSLNLPDKPFKAQAMSGMPPQLVEVRLKDLEISTGGLAAMALDRKDVSFSELSVAGATILVFENPESETTPGSEETAFPGSLTLSNISLSNLQLEVRPLNQPGVIRHLVSLLGMQGHLKVENGKISVPRDFSAEDLHFKDELHTYRLHRLDYNRPTRGLLLKDLQIVPNYDKEAFSQQIRFQKDRYDLQVDSVRISALDLEALLNNRQLTADSILIDGGQLEIYRDRRVPFDTTQRRDLPVSLIRKSSLALNVAAAMINGMDVDYTERPEDGGRAATIPFTGLQVTLKNLTNVQQRLEKDSLMHISAQAHTLGQALLQAQFTYNLRDANGGFRAEGELGDLRLEQLNPVLMPLAGAEINQGNLSGITFSFAGNDMEASGTLHMRYADLDITLEPGRSALRQNIVNWAARNFVYHSANPSPGQQLREASIEYERDPSRFVFHYWWHNFLSGVKNTVLR